MAIERVNAVYGLELLQKNDDEADAICIGMAYFNNAEQCNGE